MEPGEQNISKARRKTCQTRKTFRGVRKNSAAELTAPTYHIKNIIVSLHLADGYFKIRFAGRTVLFCFDAVLDESGKFNGRVQCYLAQELPEPSQAKVGEFIFDAGGLTNLKEPEEGDQISIQSDIGAVYIALSFLHESLSL